MYVPNNNGSFRLIGFLGYSYFAQAPPKSLRAYMNVIAHNGAQLLEAPQHSLRRIVLDDIIDNVINWCSTKRQ